MAKKQQQTTSKKPLRAKRWIIGSLCCVFVLGATPTLYFSNNQNLGRTIRLINADRLPFEKLRCVWRVAQTRPTFNRVWAGKRLETRLRTTEEKDETRGRIVKDFVWWRIQKRLGGYVPKDTAFKRALFGQCNYWLG